MTQYKMAILWRAMRIRNPERPLPGIRHFGPTFRETCQGLVLYRQVQAVGRNTSHAEAAAAASRGGSEEGARNTPPPTVERVQVEDPKINQYASHCQMCLCRRTPEELAPAGSYIEWEEVRRRVVEAHHVDLKSAGGARHAGNLILLCKFHHHNYGRRLTRAAVASALLRDREDRMIRFGRSHEAADVGGQVVKIVLADTAEVVELFFTNEHASYWCFQARSSAGARDAD